MTRPIEYPPPYRADEFIGAPSDPLDERIEVGMLVVGAGPAGLACAIRFGRLLESDPELAEQLGDVPLLVIDKGKQAGSHLMSGAIVNPRSLRQLFGADFDLSSLPNYGAVKKESVYVLTSRAALAIPTPPPMQNEGNVIFSLSALGRALAEHAEAGGAMIMSQTVAERLLVQDGGVIGVRTGDKGRDVNGAVGSVFEPGNDITAKLTVLAEGTQGHLSGVALDHFALRADSPQTWELGVKEVWRVKRPLDRVIHTMGWPLRTAARYREFGGSFIYPLGDDLLTIGMVVGLDYRDDELSVHDLLQELKTHPKIRALLEGGERIEWGAKTIPSGGFHALPKRFHVPGALLCGDGVGLVNIPTLKGVHYAIESGRLAAETAYASLKESTPLSSYDESLRKSFIWSDLHATARDVRAVFGRGFFVGGALASAMTISKGAISIGKMDTERDDAQPLLHTGRAKRYPQADGKLTFDKVSSVFASGNKSHDDQPNHIRLSERVPLEVARMWAHLCPAQVYEVGEAGADGLVEVQMAPSNCVQCGAISAKGGRLTPPEGASGPEYSLT